MDSIIKICSELSDLANIISNPGMYLQPIMSAINQSWLYVITRDYVAIVQMGVGRRHMGEGYIWHFIRYLGMQKPHLVVSFGKNMMIIWKPTCLLLILERKMEEQPKTLEIQIESEESEPTHLDLILPPFLRRDRPGESWKGEMPDQIWIH